MHLTRNLHVAVSDPLSSLQSDLDEKVSTCLKSSLGILYKAKKLNCYRKYRKNPFLSLFLLKQLAVLTLTLPQRDSFASLHLYGKYIGVSVSVGV